MEYYIIYKTINNINGKFYIGMHVTSDLEDRYLGSGRNLKLAIKKYGRENFTREIIKICSSREEMISTEREIVNEAFLSDENVYNIEIGGSGGKIWTLELRNKMSETQKNKYVGQIHPNTGKKVGCRISKEKLLEMSDRMQGDKNPMYGKNIKDYMDPDKYIERCEKISVANRKPKANTMAYAAYAAKRFWIVNKDNKLCHCIDDNDPRLVSGEYIRGKKKWVQEGSF